MSMRIAMIGHKRVPSREGGIEVVVGELSHRMVSLGHDVTLYNRRGQADMETGEYHSELDRPHRWRGVDIRPVPTIRAKGLAALSSSFFATLKAIVQRPDVVHYHAEGPCVPLVLAHIAGLKTVVTIHGLDWQRAKWGKFASIYIKLGEKVAARFADQIIVLSHNLGRYFQDSYGRQTHVIPNGSERKYPVSALEISKRWALTQGSYLLYIGRIVPEKNIHLLIDAFRSLDTPMRLVIAGSDMDSEEYGAQIRRSAAEDDRIIMTGFVEGTLLEELYSNAALYVLPSDLEGMPLSLLEAMSYGCACVSSDIPECREVLQEAGAFFMRGNKESLRSVLNSLLNDERQRMRLGHAAAERTSAFYGWDAVVEQTLAVYRDALGARVLRRVSQ